MRLRLGTQSQSPASGNTGQAPATGNACQDTASGALAPLKHRRLAPSAPVSLISPGFQNSSALKPQGPRDTPPPHGTPLDLVSRKSTSWSPMTISELAVCWTPIGRKQNGFDTTRLARVYNQL